MKKLLIALVVLVVVYFGALFFIKSSSSNILAHELEQLNQNAQLTAELVEEDSGLFTGSAKIDVKMTSDPNVAFSIVQKQSYGPILFTDEGIKLGLYYVSADLVPGETLKQEIPESINADDLFDIYFVSGFSGKVEGDVYFKGMDFSEDGVDVSISKAEMHIDTDASYKQMTGEASWPGMTVSNKGEDGFTLSGLKLNFDQTLVSGDLLDGTGIYSGDATYAIDEVVFKQAQNFFKMTNMSISGKAEVQESGKAMDVAVSMNSDLVDFFGEKFTDNSINLFFNNLDMDSLKEMGEISGKMQESAMRGEDVSAYQMQLMNTMFKMVEGGPSIQLKDTQVKTEDGVILAKLDVNVDKEKVDAANPMSLMMAVDAALNAEAPEAFFAKKGFAPMLDQWAQMNFIVRDNGTLKVDATFKNGTPMVNGQPMQGMPGM